MKDQDAGTVEVQLTRLGMRRTMFGDVSRGLTRTRRHILLVEDNRDGRESLRLLLSLLGHRVDVAADGIEGVVKAFRLRPDIALIDIGLPRLDGYQVARRIRTLLGQKIILIAYTAYDSADARERVAEAGFDAHLVKPIELRELAPWLDVGPLVAYDTCS